MTNKENRAKLLEILQARKAAADLNEIAKGKTINDEMLNEAKTIIFDKFIHDKNSAFKNKVISRMQKVKNAKTVTPEEKLEAIKKLKELMQQNPTTAHLFKGHFGRIFKKIDELEASLAKETAPAVAEEVEEEELEIVENTPVEEVKTTKKRSYKKKNTTVQE